MKIGNILNYGVFDSKKIYKNEKITPIRRVEAFEFDYILSCDSSAVSFIDEKNCRLLPNMLIIRKPGEKSNSHLHFKCYCLHLQIEPTNPLFNELFSTPSYFTFISDNTYRPLFETLFQHLAKNDKGINDYFISAKILEFIYHIKKDEKYNQSIHQNLLKKENRSIQKAISYLKRNYDKKIQLNELGILTGYSPNHFQRLFIQVIGISPSKYLENIRIDRAKYLLIENEKSLSDIAYECGFSSPSYFSKVFKKHTLLSPYDFQMSAIFKYSE